MAFDINIWADAGQEGLEAELWCNGTQDTNVGTAGQIALTENLSVDGHYYAHDISLTGVADDTYAILITDGLTYITTIMGEVVVVDELTQGDYLEREMDLKATQASVNTVDTVVDGIQTDLSNGTDGLGAIKTAVDTVDLKVDGVDTVVDGIQTDLDNGTDGLGALKTLIDTIDANVDTVLIDTNELQTNQSNWLTATSVDLNINAITSAVVATNAFSNSAFTTGYYNSINAEVDTALADYGANTVAPDNASIALILADTNELQTNQGNWLTATGFNTVAPDNASIALILADTNELQTNQGNWATITSGDVADAVWSESHAGYVTAGTFGLDVAKDADLTNNTNLITAHGDANWFTATGFATEAKQDIIDTIVDAIKSKTDSLTFSLAGVVDANMTAISDDTTASDNLEAMYDGTGYVDELAPSSRAQVDALGSGSGGSIPFQAIEDNTGGAIDPSSAVFVGSVTSGTYTNTQNKDDSSHEMNDTANDIDIVYGFQVGGGRIGTQVQISANVEGNADEIKVKAYNHTTTNWDIIGTIEGSGGIAFKTLEPVLFLAYTGTGAELGKVYIRFETDSTTPSSLEIDQCVVLGANIGQSVGYSGGYVYLDTNASNTNTEAFVDGVADNPVSTIASALSLCTAIGVKKIRVSAGSSFTMASSFEDFEIEGHNYTIAFGGQDITNASITGATVSGTFVGSTAILTSCIINAITGDGAVMRSCYLNEVTITNNGTSDWYLNDCRSRIAGTGRVTFDFGSAIGASGVSIRNYSGGIGIQNMNTGDTLSAEGFGNLVLEASCTAGTIARRGVWDFTDNSTGTTLVIDKLNEDVEAIIPHGDANWSAGGTSAVGYEIGFVYIDTNVSNTNTVDYVDGILTNPVEDLATAQTICASLGLTRIYVLGGSDLTLTASVDDYFIDGNNYIIRLNGQSIDNTIIKNAIQVSGTYASSEGTIKDSKVASITGGGITMYNCLLEGTLTHTSGSGAWSLYNCISEWTGNLALPFDANSTLFSFIAPNFQGNIEFQNGASNPVSLTGKGRFVNKVGSTIASLSLSGHWDYDNNGTVTVLYEDDINRVVDEIVDDTDTMEADIKSYGDANWLTATGFATEAKQDIIDTNVDAILVDTDTMEADIKSYGDANWLTAVPLEMTEAELHIALDSYTNKANWKATGFNTVAPDNASIAAILVDTDTMEADIIAHGDANWTTGAGGTAPTEAEMYTYFTSVSREDLFKADVSGLATQASVDIIDANVDAILVDTDTMEADIKSYGDANWLTAVPLEMTEAELHIALDSYTNKANWKATGFNTVAPDNASIAAILVDTDTMEADIIAHGDANWTTGAGGTAPTEAEMYTYFTSVSREDLFKADVSGLATQASVDTIDANVDAILVDTDTMEADIKSYGDANWLTAVPLEMTEAELHIALDSYTNKANWKATGFNTVAPDNASIAAILVDTDTMEADIIAHGDANWVGAGSAPTEAEMYTYFTSVSREDLFKADVSGLATQASVDTIDANVDAILVDTDTMEADIKSYGDANWLTAVPLEMTEAELHIALDSYTNKANWKATGFNTVAPDNASIAAILVDTDTMEADIIAHGDANWVGAGSAPTEAEMYTYFTSVSREDLFKADVSGLATQVSVDTIKTYGDANWLTATGFNTVVPDNTQGAAVIAHGDGVGAWDGISGLTAADIYTYFTDLSREDAFKADITTIPLDVWSYDITGITADDLAATIVQQILLSSTRGGEWGELI